MTSSPPAAQDVEVRQGAIEVRLTSRWSSARRERHAPARTYATGASTTPMTRTTGGQPSHAGTSRWSTVAALLPSLEPPDRRLRSPRRARREPTRPVISGVVATRSPRAAASSGARVVNRRAGSAASGMSPVDERWRTLTRLRPTVRDRHGLTRRAHARPADHGLLPSPVTRTGDNRRPARSDDRLELQAQQLPVAQYQLEELLVRGSHRRPGLACGHGCT